MVAPAVPRSLRATPAPRSGPSVTGRALLALGFLLGFYALAVAAIAALVAANVALFVVAGRASAQLVLGTLVVAAAVVRGVFFTARADAGEQPGVPIDDRSQPEVVGLVRAVARDMGTQPPARILLVPEVNAAVHQTGGLLGMRQGERIMVLGVPLIEALTVDELRGVIAHELGHYAGGDTRLGALTYRAGASIYRTVENLGHHSLLGRVFSAYGRQYLALSQGVRRQQELSADAAAVRLAGRENHMTALRRVEVTAYAFDHFVGSYLVPLWKAGCDVENAFEGYRALLDDPKRAEQLVELQAMGQDATTDRYDSHPSLTERLVHAQMCPEGPWADQDDRPARDLLVDLEGAERQVAALLTHQVAGRQMERVVQWDGTAAEVFAGGYVEDAAALLRATGAVVGNEKGATLAWALALVEDGRGDELAAAITGPVDEGTREERAALNRRVLHHYLGSAIASFLATERAHSWAISWSGPLGVVDGKGKFKDTFELADSLLDDPSSMDRLCRSLGGVNRLNGFRADDLPVPEPEPPLPSVVQIVTDVDAHRHHYDLVLFTTAVVLHPIAKGWGYAIRRLMRFQGVSGPALNDAQRRLEELFSSPAEHVLGKATGAVVFPLDQLQQLRKRRGAMIEIQAPGTGRGCWRLRCPSKKIRDGLLRAIQEILVSRLPGA